MVFQQKPFRGGEWYLEKRGSRKILAGSRNLGSIFDKSRSLVFAWFVFTFFESQNFLPKSLGFGFLTRISASRWVSDFTIRHPSFWKKPISFANWLARQWSGWPVLTNGKRPMTVLDIVDSGFQGLRFQIPTVIRSPDSSRSPNFTSNKQKFHGTQE